MYRQLKCIPFMSDMKALLHSGRNVVLANLGHKVLMRLKHGKLLRCQLEFAGSVLCAISLLIGLFLSNILCKVVWKGIILRSFIW